MALPGGTTTITCTAQYEDLSGNKATGGTVTFTGAASPLNDTSDKIMFYPVPIVANISGTGTISVVLPTTDQWAPLNWGWEVDEVVSFSGGQVFRRTYFVQIPSSLGSTVDLVQLSPASSAPETTQYLQTGGGVLTGNVVLANQAEIANVFPSGDTGGGTDTAAIQAALNLGTSTVQLARGVYYINAPLTIPPYTALVGVPETSQVAEHNTGSVLKIVAGFAGLTFSDSGSVTIKSAILLLGESFGGYATVSEEQRIRNIMVDGSSAPASVNGITTYGRIQRHRFEDILVSQVTGIGVQELLDNAGNQPDAHYMERVFVRFNGGIGFSLRAADSTHLDCLASNTGGIGWFLNSTSNSLYSNCRSEHSGDIGWGYVNVNNGNSSGGVTFLRCSTDQNTKHGFQVGGTINSVTSIADAPPVHIIASNLKRDGANGGSGGGGYAGFYNAAYGGPVVISGGMIGVGVNDDGSGTNSPATGLLADSSSLGSVSGTHIQGASTAITDNAGLSFDNSVSTATGTTSSPSVVMSPEIANYQGKSLLVTGSASAGLLSVDGSQFTSMQAADMGYLTQSWDATNNSGTGVGMSNGTAAGAAGVVYLIKCPLYGQTISTTGVRLWLTTAGGTLTASQNFIFLFKSNGTFVAASPDQSTAWVGSTGAIDASWTSGPFSVTDSFVWIGLVYNGTTAPSFIRGTNTSAALANGKLSAAQSRYGKILTGVTTATPGNITPSSITQEAATVWGALF